MNPILQAVAKTFSYWLNWADTHCWSCEQEWDYQSGKCPHCNADQTPF